MRVMAVVGCVIMLAAGCFAEGETRGRDLTIRGMKIIAQAAGDDEQEARGWDLVAQGLGVLLTLPGKWDEEIWELRGDVHWFLKRCAWAAGLSKAYWLGSFQSLGGVQRDSTGPCDAVLVTSTYGDIANSPALRDWFMLIGNINGQAVTAAWRQDIGRRLPVKEHCADGSTRIDGCFSLCDWAAWAQGGKLRAVFAGGWNWGGTGGIDPPMATLVEAVGNRWRVVATLGPPHEHLGWQNYPYRAEDEHGAYRLDDVDGDGVPEVVGHSRYCCWVGETKYVPKHYVVYKLIGRRFAKVWYAKLETPEMVLLRLDAALGLGNERMLGNISTSPEVIRQVKAMPIWEDGLHPGPQTRLVRHADRMRATIPCSGPDYHVDMTQLSKWRWRISGIERVEPSEG